MSTKRGSGTFVTGTSSGVMGHPPTKKGGSNAQSSEPVRAADALESYKKGKRFVKDVVKEIIRTKDNQLVRTMAKHEIARSKLQHKVVKLVAKAKRAETFSEVKDQEATELLDVIGLLNRAVLHASEHGNVSREISSELMRKTKVVINRDMESEEVVDELQQALTLAKEQFMAQAQEKNVLEEESAALRHALEMLLGKAESTMEQRGRQAVEALVREASDDLAKIEELRQDPHLAKIADERATQLAEMSAAKKEMDRLKGERRAMEDALKKAEHEVVQMRLKMMERDSSIAVYNKKIKAVETKLQDEINTSAARIEAAEKVSGDLTKRYEGELKKVRENMETTAKKLNEQKRVMEHYKGQVTDAKFETARIKKQLENEKAEMGDQLRAELGVAEDRVKELEEKVRAETADLTNRYAMAETNAIKKTTELNELKEEHLRAKKSLEEAQLVLAEQAAELEQQHRMMERENQEQGNVSHELRDTMERMKKLEQELHFKTAELKVLEDANSNLEDDLSSAMRQASAAEKDASAAKEKWMRSELAKSPSNVSPATKKKSGLSAKTPLASPLSGSGKKKGGAKAPASPLSPLSGIDSGDRQASFESTSPASPTTSFSVSDLKQSHKAPDSYTTPLGGAERTALASGESGGQAASVVPSILEISAELQESTGEEDEAVEGGRTPIITPRVDVELVDVPHLKRREPRETVAKEDTETVAKEDTEEPVPSEETIEAPAPPKQEGKPEPPSPTAPARPDVPLEPEPAAALTLTPPQEQQPQIVSTPPAEIAVPAVAVELVPPPAIQIPAEGQALPAPLAPHAIAIVPPSPITTPVMSPAPSGTSEGLLSPEYQSGSAQSFHLAGMRTPEAPPFLDGAEEVLNIDNCKTKAEMATAQGTLEAVSDAMETVQEQILQIQKWNSELSAVTKEYVSEHIAGSLLELSLMLVALTKVNTRRTSIEAFASFGARSNSLASEQSVVSPVMAMLAARSDSVCSDGITPAVRRVTSPPSPTSLPPPAPKEQTREKEEEREEEEVPCEEVPREPIAESKEHEQKAPVDVPAEQAPVQQPLEETKTPTPTEEKEPESLETKTPTPTEEPLMKATFVDEEPQAAAPSKRSLHRVDSKRKPSEPPRTWSFGITQFDPEGLPQGRSTPPEGPTLEGEEVVSSEGDTEDEIERLKTEREAKRKERGELRQRQREEREAQHQKLREERKEQKRRATEAKEAEGRERAERRRLRQELKEAIAREAADEEEEEREEEESLPSVVSSALSLVATPRSTGSAPSLPVPSQGATQREDAKEASVPKKKEKVATTKKKRTEGKRTHKPKTKTATAGSEKVSPFPPPPREPTAAFVRKGEEEEEEATAASEEESEGSTGTPSSSTPSSSSEVSSFSSSSSEDESVASASLSTTPSATQLAAMIRAQRRTPPTGTEAEEEASIQRVASLVASEVASVTSTTSARRREKISRKIQHSLASFGIQTSMTFPSDAEVGLAVKEKELVPPEESQELPKAAIAAAPTITFSTMSTQTAEEERGEVSAVRAESPVGVLTSVLPEKPAATAAAVEPRSPVVQKDEEIQAELVSPLKPRPATKETATQASSEVSATQPSVSAARTALQPMTLSQQLALVDHHEEEQQQPTPAILSPPAATKKKEVEVEGETPEIPTIKLTTQQQQQRDADAYSTLTAFPSAVSSVGASPRSPRSVSIVEGQGAAETKAALGGVKDPLAAAGSPQRTASEVSIRDTTRQSSKHKGLKSLAGKLGYETEEKEAERIALSEERGELPAPTGALRTREEHQFLVMFLGVENSERETISTTCFQLLWEIQGAFRTGLMELRVKKTSESFVNDAVKRTGSVQVGENVKKFVEGQVQAEKERQRVHQRELLALRTALTFLSKAGASSTDLADQLQQMQGDLTTVSEGLEEITESATLAPEPSGAAPTPPSGAITTLPSPVVVEASPSAPGQPQVSVAKYNVAVRTVKDLKHELESQKVVANIHTAMQESHQRQLEELREQMGALKTVNETLEASALRHKQELTTLKKKAASPKVKKSALATRPTQVPQTTTVLGAASGDAVILATSRPRLSSVVEEEESKEVPVLVSKGEAPGPQAQPDEVEHEGDEERTASYEVALSAAEATSREREVQVSSLFNTVGAFLLEAQSLVNTSHLPASKPLMYTDRPLIAPEQVEQKLHSLLGALQMEETERVLVASTEEGKAAKKGKKEKEKKTKTKKHKAQEGKKAKEEEAEAPKEESGLVTSPLESVQRVESFVDVASVVADAEPASPRSSIDESFSSTTLSDGSILRTALQEIATGEVGATVDNDRPSVRISVPKNDEGTDTQSDLVDLDAVILAAESLEGVKLEGDEVKSQLDDLVAVLSQHEKLAHVAQMVESSKKIAPDIQLHELEDWSQLSKEEKVQRVLKAAKRRLEKVQLKDLLDRQMRAGIALALDSNMEEPARGNNALTVLAKTRRRALRSIMSHVADGYLHTEADQSFIKSMFRSFPKVFVENAAAEFDPRMTFELLNQLSTWWNKCVKEHALYQQHMSAERQEQLEKLLHLCELLEQTSVAVNAEYRHLLPPGSREEQRAQAQLSDLNLADYLMQRGKRKQHNILGELDRQAQQSKFASTMPASYGSPGGANSTQQGGKTGGAASNRFEAGGGMFGLVSRVAVADPKQSHAHTATDVATKKTKRRRSSHGIHKEEEPRLDLTLTNRPGSTTLPTVATLKKPLPNLGSTLPYFNTRHHSLGQQGEGAHTPPPSFKKKPSTATTQGLLTPQPRLGVSGLPSIISRLSSNSSYSVGPAKSTRRRL